VNTSSQPHAASTRVAPNEPNSFNGHKSLANELIVAQNVSKAYGAVPVLTDVSFTVPSGVTGLLGANGAGKPTLLGMLLGLHNADGGLLSVLGADPWTTGHEVRARIGYAPEHHTLPPLLRAADFVRHVAELHGLPPKEATTRASDALWLVDLGEERFRAMGTMSTGQRQRVKLAQAIAHDPEIIFLDEPTDGLDPVQRESMLDLIRSVSSEYGISVLLSSHLIDEVERVCDNAIIIGDGRTLAAGSLDDLRGQGATGIYFEVDCNEHQGSQLISALASRSFNATIDGRRIVVDRDDGDAFDAIRDACVDVGVGISKLNRRRLSLEDVFIEQLG